MTVNATSVLRFAIMFTYKQPRLSRRKLHNVIQRKGQFNRHKFILKQ